MMSLEATAATEGCCLKLTWRWIKHSKSSLTKKGPPLWAASLRAERKTTSFQFRNGLLRGPWKATVFVQILGGTAEAVPFPEHLRD